MGGSDSCGIGEPSTTEAVERVLRGISVPRTTVGMLSVGVKEEGLSTTPGVNGPRAAGARPRNKPGVAGGYRRFTNEGVGVVRLGGVGLTSETVIFVALRDDSLEAIFRRGQRRLGIRLPVPFGVPYS